MDENLFRVESDAALDDLFRTLARASDEHDFEADLNGGALTVEFEEPPAKFVVSPNAPVRQIWVSALTTSFKLEWESARNAFVLPASGQTLRQLMASVISRQLGEPVEL
ncbi:MAG: iron donor protein CyaY [Bryobacterales bacterium]|nr:iron donor protein CyaY [Bryobacterales bacterium]